MYYNKNKEFQDRKFNTELELIQTIGLVLWTFSMTEILVQYSTI